ncbi:hypothetical protein ABL78_6181 [Leptomonas seymouri]|uniref:Uncharacterized protein n=1 Tax=Leptomonas seymouri TaxID=5684 RepID=A0A0N1I167_LEPSE|nr:hypothetical protein ABL78_6181 [Leptomonas seymouri]|eukprot:KPI84763.1 hypothetical protein ABL78_6181 [Leptomonas seymouri]
MFSASFADEATRARPSFVGGSVSAQGAFHPILFSLSSLTSENIDAAVVARLLQPHFKAGDFYIINAATINAPGSASPDGKRAGSAATSHTSTPRCNSELIKAGVQRELVRIATAREEARQAAAQAQAAQLSALQEEYLEDGLSPEDALAAAQAELQSHSDSEEEDEIGEDGDGSGGDGKRHKGEGGDDAAARRLPPCVCILNLPLTCSTIDRFARGIHGMAAALLLESRCCVRELVPVTTTVTQSGAAGAGDKAKSRGGGANNSATVPSSKSSLPFNDDLLKYLSGATTHLQDDGNGLPNVLVKRLEYPTEAADKSQGGAASTFRPSVSPSHFVSTLHALLLRIFRCWLRYEAWRSDRVFVRVPPYAPPREAEATAEGKALEEPAAPILDLRLGKRKSAAAPGFGPDALAFTSTSALPSTAAAAAADPAAIAAAHPRTMEDVAAERFEYGAFMRRWAVSQQPNVPRACATAGLYACLAACLRQVSCDHGTSTLRSCAETSAAQLQEDVKAAREMVSHSYVMSSGGGAEGCLPRTAAEGTATVEAATQEAFMTPFRLTAPAEDHNADAANLATAETIEAALAQFISREVAGDADALSVISAALMSAAGEGDALHWLRSALVPREQNGWHVSTRPWRSATLCCLHRPANPHRIAHSAFVFHGLTTFPQFYNDEDFLEAEERVDESGEDEEEEEDEEDEEDVLEDSIADTQSTVSADSSAPPSTAKEPVAPTTATTALKQKSSLGTLTPAASLVDHTSVVLSQLRRRRVLDQVRACHARPARQEVGVSPDRCQSVVTETNWMHAVDGTLIEVAWTAANSCQVRCTVMADPSGRVQGGYVLECPAPSTPNTAGSNDTSPSTTALDASARDPLQQSHSLELTVESGVRGFLSVDDRLRVFTKVVADNSHAVELAAYALAVAAAKEAAVAQFEAQFSKGSKAGKGRAKGSTAATPLSLEDITATLLAALPPPPEAVSSPSELAAAGSSTSAAAPPPLMHVHALFPSHRCVLTSVVSRAAVPGVRLALLPDSEHAASSVYSNAKPSLCSPLFTVHLWWQDRLCVVPVLHLSAAHFYVDGVAELFSTDLSSSVRVLLHPNGSYLTEAGAYRLFVNPRGCCTLYEEGAPASRVVHQLHSGWAAAVTNSAVRRAEREDGLQQEYLSPEKAGDVSRGPTGGLGVLSRTLFGPGVAVHRGDGPDKWLWQVARLPMITCDAATRTLGAALDSSGTDRLVYAPDQHKFQLHMKGAHSLSSRVAATFSLTSSRLTLWGDAVQLNEEKPQISGFEVDCAYGGVCGRVQASHLYRVSPFGRCTEEVAVTQANTTHWQLVLPSRYKRPKKKEPEVVLLPEYTSKAFHHAVGGRANDGESSPEKEGDTASHTVVLHLQRDPPEPRYEDVATEDGSTPDDGDTHSSAQEERGPGSIFANTTAASAGAQGMQVQCAAFNNDDSTVAIVMDTLSWSKYAQWLVTLPEKALHLLPSKEAAPTRPFRVRAFEVEAKSSHDHDLYPLTVVDDDAAIEPAPPAQRCVFYSFTDPSSEAPAWHVSTELSTALEECRRGDGSNGTEVASDLPVGPTEVHADAEENNAHGTQIASSCEQLELAEQGAVEQPTDTPAQRERAGEETGRLSLPSVSRVSSALNYWSSPCCPRSPLPENPPRANLYKSETSTSTTEVAADTDAAPARVVGGGTPTPPPPSGPRTRKLPPASSKMPLMYSYTSPADEQTGTTASSRFHEPLLSVQPQLVDFGNVYRGRRYVAKFELTNTSTVPCRYRIRTPAALRPFLVLSYPHHFVAPGITVEVAIELSGWQPHGVMDSELTIVHEGGVAEVGVVWCTTDAAHSVQMGRGVVCTGWSVSKPVLQHPLKVAAADAEDREVVEEKVKRGSSDSDASTAERIF